MKKYKWFLFFEDYLLVFLLFDELWGKCSLRKGKTPKIFWIGILQIFEASYLIPNWSCIKYLFVAIWWCLFLAKYYSISLPLLLLLCNFPDRAFIKSYKIPEWKAKQFNWKCIAHRFAKCCVVFLKVTAFET